MEKWNSTVLSINKTCKALGDRCLEILGVHFLSGSDTTSYPFGKGKQTVLNIAKRFSFPEFDSVLGDLNATDMQLQQLGRKFFCALYQQSNEKSLSKVRYDLYMKKKGNHLNLKPSLIQAKIYCCM